MLTCSWPTENKLQGFLVCLFCCFGLCFHLFVLGFLGGVYVWLFLLIFFVCVYVCFGVNFFFQERNLGGRKGGKVLEDVGKGTWT